MPSGTRSLRREAPPLRDGVYYYYDYMIIIIIIIRTAQVRPDEDETPWLVR